MLNIHNSNRLESLFYDLSDLLSTPLVNPLAPEIVLVQSQGMARWLALQTAAKEGIAANIDCSFPATFIWRLLRGDNRGGAGDPYEREALAWTIFALLDGHLEQAEFAPVAKYLAGPQHSLKLYQLSQKIAGLFDQYMMFRPDWIQSWSDGGGEGWQPVLWRAVQKKCSGPNRAEMLTAFLQSSGSTAVRQAKLPERLSLFGIPALSPAMFAFFAKLADYVDVHIFLLQPCREFWADLASKDELRRMELRAGRSNESAGELHFSGGNALLLNMGKMGRDFQHVLCSFDYTEFHNFSAPKRDSLLAAVQADIIMAVDAGEEKICIADEEDRSIQIHSVPSPMREVEVLYQNLLNLFQANDELNPADVLVMVPDINLYAPFIEAVFSTSEQENQKIPYSIADRGACGQETVKAFLSLISLLPSRMSSSEVFDFLAQEKIRKHFDIKEAELETVRFWIEKSAINWGLNGQHREELGLPRESYGTWEAGLDRLLLGYALPESEFLFYDILPCDQTEGQTAQLLAKFFDFFGKLTRGCRQAAGLKKPAEWARFLRQLFEDFVGGVDSSSGVGQRENRIIRAAIDTFARQTDTARFNQEIPFEIVQRVLRKEFDNSFDHTEFLGGRVTFCQMVPMRSIPFPVICLLGMNDDAFPRQDRPVGFDLMADNFRVGDRCRRDDDRYIFLETVSAARKILYISYVGIGVRSGETFPPSVVVSELLAAAAPYLAGEAKEAVQRLTTVHPLQPFAERYFRGEPHLYNFSGLYYETARTIRNDSLYGGLFRKRLEKIEKIDLSIAEFLAFFEHPVRYLLRAGLGLHLDDRHSDLNDREMFALDSLAKYTLLNGIVDSRLAGVDKDIDQAVGKLRQQGAVPYGGIGRYAWNDAAEEVDAFLRPFGPRLTEPRLQPIPLELDLGGVRVSGTLDNIWPAGQFLIRPISVQRLLYRDSIRFWILHLLLNASDKNAVRTTCFIGKDGVYAYLPFDGAVEELTLLAQMVLEGMQAPLPVLPKATLAFAQKMWNGATLAADSENMEKAIRAAESKWSEGDYFNGPEKDDPYFWAAFGDGNLFSEGSEPRFGFVNCARMLLRKALQLRTTIGPGAL
jgi:exodeoxyribonuclease V gamma subunit